MAEVNKRKGKKQKKLDCFSGSNPREQPIKEGLSARRIMIAPGIQSDAPGACESANCVHGPAWRASIRSIAHPD